MIKTINKYQLLEFLCIFIITMMFNLICVSMNHDEIWNYGFAYNIASGLIPYKDFNMIITPLSPLLNAIFMMLLGKNIITLHIINSIICTCIFFFMKKNYSKCYYIIYAIFLFYSLPNYNILCLLLLYILIDIENIKGNDFIIGLLIGLIFITKQNIGIYLLIPSIITNIKNFKSLLNRCCGFIIPIIILIVYLICTNSFYNFIDYCFLGINDFAKKNLSINYIYLTVLILSIIYIIWQYIKTKKNIFLYLLFYSFIAFPIIEDYHVMLVFIPTFGFFLSNLNLNKRIISYAFILFITIIFSINIYTIHTEEFKYPNITNQYKFRRLNNSDAKSIELVSNYISEIDERLYTISSTAYLIKLESNKQINKYDLLNNGNLGKNGAKKLINEIKNNCQKEKCVFLVDITDTYKPELTQFNQEIIHYIINNYNDYGNLYNYELKIYKNY